MRKRLIYRVFRTGCLYHKHSFPATSSCPSAELLQELERPFVRPEILLAQKRIRHKHGHKRETVKIKAFRDYLSTDEYIYFPVSEIPDYL